MAQAMAAGELDLGDGAAMLAELLRRLHELPPLPGAARQILHLDLHPENVMLTGRGPVVIDWCNATDGPGDLDTALSALIVAQVAIEHSHPWSPAAGAFLDAFLVQAPGDPLRLLDEATALRARQLSLRPDETGLLATAAARVRGAA
jgi:Ser/Thr protein kinase RdoA (MazF antagonist)